MKNFRKKLKDWFLTNKRDLPWRQNTHWYTTLLSELILQQTTVQQGLPYYHKFVKKYPDIFALANAGEQEVLHLWAGLGYYARGRNLLKTAKALVAQHNGDFPADLKQALALPGIGPYSAAAILSIAFDKPYAVIDGNVIRVICRLFGISTDTRNAATIKKIKSIGQRLLDKGEPGVYNEGMMELGALVCTPKLPKCKSCPLQNYCRAYNKNLTESIPCKSPPAAKSKKYNLVGLCSYKNKICIMRRLGKGLLAGMWELPVLEIAEKNFFEANDESFAKEYKINGKYQKSSPDFRHIYSHIDLRYSVHVFDLNNNQINQKNYVELRWCKFSELSNFAIHNAHKKILDWYASDIKKI